MRTLNFIVLLIPFCLFGQIGIGTLAPKGVLDISSSDTGLVIPRVTKIEDVTDGNGNEPIDGTAVYDISRNKTCFKIDGEWVCIDDLGNITVVDIYTCESFVYLKPSNAESQDYFGSVIALSQDGTILAVSHAGENSNATGINGDDSNNLATTSGAVFIFSKSNGIWSQEAFIKASNTDTGDLFGFSMALNDTGDVLAVGANNEDSAFQNNQADNSITNAGAVYIFRKSAGSWSQTAYIKAPIISASNNGNGTGETFGASIDFNSDGTILAVGAPYDDNPNPGINPNLNASSTQFYGGVYLYSYNGFQWQFDDYIKPAIVGQDYFGAKVKLDDVGDRLFVSATMEGSNSTTINSGANLNNLFRAGAVYAFVKNAGVWSQEAYIKPWAIDAQDYFGSQIDINDDGSVLAVGTFNEDSNAIGINGNPNDNSQANSGAVFTFTRSGITWSPQTYIKAPFAVSGWFSHNLSLSSSGEKLFVGAPLESSDAMCFDGDYSNTNRSVSGGVFLYEFDNSNWILSRYIKAPNPDSGDWFGEILGISPNGNYLTIGARREDSIDYSQTNNSLDVGALYIVD
ncbi:FG-GAP repeat protein [Ulvibacter sp. MAR_2010_11]|uniref:FG-GAP repeat protein n=1 Tax=Ulvibacter sp. MAR_2010_11 TaxID=1250229 RepID=UPI000C2CC686|nr:FG-GAP repeat protein [Ulvibacter sp. MAR_2010_11]PKA82561.1 FG-GAP repeat protein [Ulvibacter sp. MAR_2010_11]